MTAPTKASSKARLSQERSRVRREQLLDATIALFAEGGARAVTHRAVAARAELPPATPGYYFDSVGDLLTTALTRHVETWIEDMTAMADLSLGLEIDLDDARGLVSMAFGERSLDTVHLQLSTFLAVSADPDLQPLAARALDAVESLAARMLATVGVTDAQAVAESLVHLMIGSAATRLTGRHDDEHTADVLFDAVRRLVATATMDPQAITDALPRANRPAD
ncbi:TetR/AcrR family transcriptional regulator [Nocardioides sp. Root140]|uniref:TetR/AcrR family transcriptional regulator n=1 Tax=Nocardioides sp. Root140 TaxID=1736460 RepID=UPI0007014AC7|nr:TetR family transcriptional regulator [Nocardioides sp. Root140]KQY62637.1 hypothetical protein ASD30_23260 [Nocardioides sp. Root140]